MTELLIFEKRICWSVMGVQKRQLLLTSSLCRLSFFKIAIFCPNPTGYISRTDDVLLYCHQQVCLSSQKKKMKLDDWTFEEYKKLLQLDFKRISNISHKIKLFILEDKAQTKIKLIVLIWYNSELCKKMSLHCQRWCWAKSMLRWQ